MGSHDIVLLSVMRWDYLLLAIVAVFGLWFKPSYPSYPKGMNQWLWRLVWFALNVGLVIAIFNYFYAASSGYSVPHNQQDPELNFRHRDDADSSYFRIRNRNYHNWTFILIIVHLVHVKLLELYSCARYRKPEYWLSTVLFLLTIAAGITLAVLTGIQHVWGAMIGYALHSLALAIVFVLFLVRYDNLTLRAMYLASKGEETRRMKE